MLSETLNSALRYNDCRFLCLSFRKEARNHAPESFFFPFPRPSSCCAPWPGHDRFPLDSGLREFESQYRLFNNKRTAKAVLLLLVTHRRFELRTPWLKVKCSTVWANESHRASECECTQFRTLIYDITNRPLCQRFFWFFSFSCSFISFDMVNYPLRISSGCLIGSLAIAKIEWSNWIKFMWKFLGILMIGAIITILIAVGIGF